MSPARHSGWRGRRVLLTGHTGFKGAWLALWLHELGAEVTGLALPPPTCPALAELVGVPQLVRHEIVDVRDADGVRRVVDAARPEVVLHLAAQSVVREGYADPVGTFATNVQGTVHVLDAVRRVAGVAAVLVVTSDKVYDQARGRQPFAEGEPLGGTEPYGASKAACELVVDAYRHSWYLPAGVPLAAARAGNVIGGGDFTADALVPDVVRALEAGVPVPLRHPDAVRPWQHVLDALDGYLCYAEALLDGPASLPPALNFGPSDPAAVRVREVVERLTVRFGGRPGWVPDAAPGGAEAALLTLSTEQAAASLGWRARLGVDEALAWTAAWYEAYLGGADPLVLSLGQLADYAALDGTSRP